jgi:response regulator NasT
MRPFFQEAVAALGHQVCVVDTGRQAVELCGAVRPDLLITDLKLPDLDGLDIAAEICRDRPIPVVVMSENHDAETVLRTSDSPVLAYLVKPIRPTDLRPAIAVALHMFARLRAYHAAADRLRQELEDRKLIERAKGMVMRYIDLEEEEAFYRLKKLAVKFKRRLADVANNIITAGEVFHQLDQVGEVKKADNQPPRWSRKSRPWNCSGSNR